jgi:hypothetical protein
MAYSRISKTDSCWRCRAAPLTDDANFCSKCGATLTRSIYYEDLAATPGSPPPATAQTRVQHPEVHPTRRLRAVFRLYGVRWFDALSSLARHSRILTDSPAMFWKIQYGRSLTMENGNGPALRYLIVNRAEVTSAGCSACGQGFASEAPGAGALSVTVGPVSGTYMFCAGCGDSIMQHLHADAVRQCHGWDWMVPLRGKALANDDTR